MESMNLVSSNRTEMLLLMAVLSEGERTAFQILRLLEDRGDPTFTLREGEIYPLLCRLVTAGHVVTQMHDTVNGPRRFYRLSRQGIRSLKREHSRWLQLQRAFNPPLKGGEAYARKSD